MEQTKRGLGGNVSILPELVRKYGHLNTLDAVLKQIEEDNINE